MTRHADVRACLRDRRLGRNFRHLADRSGFPDAPLDPRRRAFWRVEHSSLLWLEPPDHTRIRRLVAAAFTPRSSERLREPAELLARELLAPHLDSGRLELLADYAQPLSIALIARLLGVPPGHDRQLLDWSHAMVKMYELDTSAEQAAAANDAAAAFHVFVSELIELRRRAPQPDLVSALADARVDGTRLADDEIVSTVVVLLNAGHEATVNTLGNGIRALLRHPEQWRRLVSREVGAAAAVEELIRWDPPLQLFERWVLEDGVEVAGRPVPRGGRLSLLFGAANRDPRVFDRPETLDVGRPNAADHVGFGGGIHACIGAPLARIELEAGLRTLVEHAPGLRLAAEPERNPAFVIWGLRAVELELG